MWFAEGKKISRQTKDVDFAVLVGSNKEYQAVRQYLIAKKNFDVRKDNDFVLFSPTGIQVDILPFGKVEIDDGVSFNSEGLESIKVNGFMEVYRFGTENVELETGHRFKVASLSSIILLKLIAFDDRPEIRSKDARDLANIIYHYFDLNANLIYEQHADLFSEEEEKPLQEISATVIGREIKKLCISNPMLILRIETMLKKHIEWKEKSSFILNKVAETEETLEVHLNRLNNILLALD